MATPPRKTVDLIVRVSVPRGMSAVRVKREVRCLINDQCNFDADPGDVRVARFICLNEFTKSAARKTLT